MFLKQQVADSRQVLLYRQMDIHTAPVQCCVTQGNLQHSPVRMFLLGSWQTVQQEGFCTLPLEQAKEYILHF